jgi:membrane protease YdiL (CAAX protease family)
MDQADGDQDLDTYDGSYQARQPPAWVLPVAVFCIVTFGISWTCWLVAGLNRKIQWNLDLHLFHFDTSEATGLTIIGTMAPGFVALLLGFATRWTIFPNPIAQLRRPYFPPFSLVFAFSSPILAVFMMLLAQEDQNLGAFSSLRISDFVTIFSMNVLLGPLWEEFGWRGCLLPILSRRFGLRWASLIVGLIWAAWHAPFYLLVLNISLQSYYIAFGTIMGAAIVLTVLYSASGNNLILPVIFHASWNAASVWVIAVQQKFDLGPVVLEAVTVWVLAGVVWLWWGLPSERGGLRLRDERRSGDQWM